MVRGIGSKTSKDLNKSQDPGKNQRYEEALRLHESGVPFYKVRKMTHLGQAALSTYLRHHSKRPEHDAYWPKQKTACAAFGKDLENAGVRKHVATPDKFNRPKIGSAPPAVSGCSSSADWDC